MQIENLGHSLNTIRLIKLFLFIQPATTMAYAAELCGSKLKAKLSSTLNESVAAPISSSSFAAKQMKKMGWTEGTGLGKKRDGIVSHIKVKKREEQEGLGVDKERTRNMGVEGMWWSTNVSSTLMKLQQKKKKDDNESEKKKSKKSKKKEKKSKKKSKETTMKVYTDEELFKATGGARFGMRAQSRATGKWARTESSNDLKKWEEEVKNQIEWNGLGKAKVLLSQTSSMPTEDSNLSKKRKRGEITEEEKKEDDMQTSNETAQIVSDTNSLEIVEEKNETVVEKKERKSEKKAKKSKKKKSKKTKKES